MQGESLQSFSRRPLRSSIIGVIGAGLAVVSIYGLWFQFSDYNLTGVQMDEFLRESFSFDLFTSAIYICPILAAVGIALVLVKPYEQLSTRCINAFLLFIATVVASVPVIRILTVQQATLESLRYFQYGFWLLVLSIFLLLASWISSLSEIRRAIGKYELVGARISRLLHEIASEIEISALAKKCQVSQKLLGEVLNKSKESLRDFIVSENKIVNKRWFRKKLEEKLK